MIRIMHDDRGYFIGRYELGWHRRISKEHYGSIEACRQALTDKSWTPRMLTSIC